MTRTLDSLVIQTPEGCRFSLPLAGPITRFLAWLIDLLIVLAIILAVCIALSIFGVILGDLAGMLLFLAAFGVWFGYGIVLEWFWNGQTVGKKILRLRVVDEHALRLTFSQVVIRNLLRMADMQPAFYLLGGIVCVLSRKLQRLGDMVAGTVVIRQPQVTLPDLVDVLGNKYNSLRQSPHLAARLRQRTSGPEAHLALTALMRREGLDSAARVELFAGIAEHFRKIVEFPQEAIEGLSDEQYVRNVVEILFLSQHGQSKPNREM
jgi:uncharacterized RDD family membrane protein YckC